MSWLDLSTACSEPAFAQRPEHERQEIVRAIQSRRPGQVWMAIGAGFGVAAVAFAIIGFLVFVLLEAASCFTVLLMICVSGIIWFVASVAELRTFVSRGLYRHLRTPLCVWCGYDLSGQAADRVAREQGTIQCPECGRTSPVVTNEQQPGGRVRPQS